MERQPNFDSAAQPIFRSRRANRCFSFIFQTNEYCYAHCAAHTVYRAGLIARVVNELQDRTSREKSRQKVAVIVENKRILR